MALTIGTPTRYSVGGRFQTSTPITFDSSYPTGGYAVTGQQLGLQAGLIDNIVCAQPSGGYVPTYNASTGSIQVFDPTSAHTHTENTAASYTQNATTGAATPSPAAEVPNATNVSTVSCTVICTGR